MPKGSVKIMLSYDYCHFEICLGNDEDMSLQEVDQMRKDAQRLADKAVEQYKIAQKMAVKRFGLETERALLQSHVDAIVKIPPSERTPEQKAKVKTLEDDEYWNKYNYDYEDI